MTWQVLAGDGSVVALDGATADELGRDDARRTRLVDGERITAHVPAAPA